MLVRAVLLPSVIFSSAIKGVMENVKAITKANKEVFKRVFMAFKLVLLGRDYSEHNYCRDYFLPLSRLRFHVAKFSD